MQDTDCKDGASPYDTNSSRSLVTIGQSSNTALECVHASPEGTREMFYRNRVCLGDRIPTEEYESEKPLEFQARCIVVLIEEQSRKALLNTLLSAGRVLDHPLKLAFNYTLSLSRNPDLAVSSMNCALGNLILENYNRDAVGQQLEGELTDLLSQLETNNTEVELFDMTLMGLSAYRPPAAPALQSPPPRPSAPHGLLAPPIPQIAVDFDTRLQQLRSEASALESAVIAKRNEIGGPCVRSATNTCGRTNAAAPDPLVAADGERCAGYQTREAMEGLFCGHWGSPVSQNAPCL